MKDQITDKMRCKMRKKTRRLIAFLLGTAVLLSYFCFTGEAASSGDSIFNSGAQWSCAEEMISEETAPGETSEIKPSELYARSAVLMDAGSGRVLFAKNGTESMAMASTTKILTCILALENGDLSDQVRVSAEAAAQPEVKLGMREGQLFYLKDLLYSLMLESHNDSAVAIAEHIGGSTEDFAEMMNRKAEEIGCADSYFITPNGLDASDENGFHHTTAKDLAGIMRYCIMLSEKKDEFLEITRTESYTFADCSQTGNYSCANHNAFLKMMDGALSGKTGFTSDAGYCYVGALRRDDRTFIVALLACGWPNNKGYKWADTGKLMNYALENYEYQEITPESLEPEDTSLLVLNGYQGRFPASGPVRIQTEAKGAGRRILLKKGEQVETEYHLPGKVEAPVEKGQELGSAVCTVDGETVAVFTLNAGAAVERRDLSACAGYIMKLFSLGRQKRSIEMIKFVTGAAAYHMIG